jgi:hypothetical protein
MWEPRRLISLRASTVYYRDSFTFFFICINTFWRVLTMVYNTQNQWAFRLCPSSGILNEVQWLRLALSNGSNRVDVSQTLPPPGEGNRSSFRKVLFRKSAGGQRPKREYEGGWYVFGFIKKTTSYVIEKMCLLYIFPLSSTHLWLPCSNFFNPSKKISLGCAANRKIRKSQRLISIPT